MSSALRKIFLRFFNTDAILTPKQKLQIWREPIIVVLFALFMGTSGSAIFYQKVISIYPWHEGHNGFLVSLWLMHGSVIVFLIAVASFFIPKRMVIGTLLFITAVAAHYGATIGAAVDVEMIRNVLSTDVEESMGLINLHLLSYLLFFAVLPASLMYYWLRIKKPLLIHAQQQFILLSGSFVLILICLFSYGSYYSTFFREHKAVRYYANPTYPIFAIGKFFQQTLSTINKSTMEIRLADAHVSIDDHDRELVILVIGETARRDRFSLNGYSKQTNPLLEQVSGLVSYSHIQSCGTSTAYSVPCMFSLENADTFEIDLANYSENILDVLKRAGISILWRDNNSNSKGVADRVQYEDFRYAPSNPICDVECRDIGMLSGLQAYIDEQTKDVLIVLHQKGNHGPEYYKRYPEAFEKFKPVCRSNEFSNCSADEINNAYDNAISYTDYFLFEVIELLKKNAPAFEATLLYLSDHGESLGEKGIYLHGLPRIIAPKEQTEVPFIVWAGNRSDIDVGGTRKLRDIESSHDALAGTLLSLFEIESINQSEQLKLVRLNHDAG